MYISNLYQARLKFHFEYNNTFYQKLRMNLKRLREKRKVYPEGFLRS